MNSNDKAKDPSDSVVCGLCRQVGELCRSPGDHFESRYFGSKDEWAFHQPKPDRWVCGTCMMDSLTVERLAEYSIQRSMVGFNEYVYRRVESLKAPFVYQRIPAAYSRSSMASYPHDIQTRVTQWMTGKWNMLTLCGEAAAAEWAIFRDAISFELPAKHITAERLFGDIRQEQSVEGFSTTLKLMRRFNGILIIHDIAMVNPTASRMEWINSILDDRISYRRKTVITLQACDQEFPVSLTSRMAKFGYVIGLDAWGETRAREILA